MLIPEETIEAIRQRTDIVAVVSQYVTLKKQGHSYLGLCPFHGEKTPSFNVNPERQMWKCFGCGLGGNVFHFLMRKDGLTFPEALERLAERAGIEIQHDPGAAERRSQRDLIFEINKAAAAFFVQQLPRAKPAQEYLSRRGLSEESIANLGIGYAPADWDTLSSTLLRRGTAGDLLEKAGLSLPRESGGYYDRFRDRIIFPIRDVEGRVLGFGSRAMGDVQPKYLNSPETPVFDKGKTLYGLDRGRRAVADAGIAIVVEGYMDAAMAYQYGVNNVVATLGTALGHNHLELLRRYAPQVVLAYDGDAAGAAAAERSIPLFEDAEMEGRILILPEGQDPDEFLRAQGIEGFQRAVAEALPLVEFQLRRLTARADLTTPEGRAALMREVVPVLAGIRNAVKREEYVRLLAESWCAGQLHRVGQVEDAIRREVQRGVRSGAPARPAVLAPRPAPAAAGEPPALPPRVVGAEKCVLQGLLHCAVPAGEIFTALAAEDFLVPAHRHVAGLLWQHRSEEPIEVARRIAAGEDETASNAVSDLLLQQEKLPATEKMVRDSLQVIKERKFKERINQLQGSLARPGLGPEVLGPLEAELHQLVRELKSYTSS